MAASLDGNDAERRTEEEQSLIQKKKLHLQMSGYGMGIPLSRHYAKFFGGDLHFASIYGFGTDVSIRLNRLYSIEERQAVDVDSLHEPGLSPSPRSPFQVSQSKPDLTGT